MLHRLRKLMLLSVLASVASIFAGCFLIVPSDPASKMGNPAGRPFTTDLVAANGKPLVWFCAPVQMASPPRYACGDNKTYTAFQLRNTRLGLTAAEAAGPL
jgi:hypothetical protein